MRRRASWKRLEAGEPGGVPMFASLGMPQFVVIVVVLFIFILYTQRHRF
jgi:hypothetical protein